MPTSAARSPALLRTLAAAAAGALLAASLLGSWAQAPAAAVSVGQGQQQVADVILALTGSLIRATLSLLPGMTLAIFIYAVYARREDMDRKKWATLVAMLLCSAVIWAVHVRLSSTGGSPPSGGSARTQAMVGPVHSGEGVVTKDGRFVTLPDPSKPEGAPVQEGWQQALASALTDAIKGGTEQVVIVFSRQGCPWCDRQLPVMGRAIQNRAKEIAEASGGAAAGAAFVGGGGPGGMNMLLSPLRVFVLDAGEFPHLAQQFRIEAFPTNMFFGQPGATPLMAQGYLNDEQLEEIIQAAAVATPQMQEQQQKPRRKRRGLFR
eukprot:CAMPEP_0115622362 /NCGR_PEP_ID=MMETSP0272-20121206/26209_1 /TAXON_ID=71861 /ORGANISM="Scrippsiella trochoidea, Strain CCMP3099" /LENGTH=320 /DNA_ID=CAMNT_0003058523 /DNA_START=87 /DNA_END=1049 /DNA_ORIENTATION=-